MIKKKSAIKESSKKFFDKYFGNAINEYKNYITSSMTLKNFCKFLDEHSYSDRFSYSQLYRQEPNIDEFIEEFEKAKSSLLKKEESLKGYLQKRLTINSKEAELIESVIKQYVRRNKVKK